MTDRKCLIQLAVAEVEQRGYSLLTGAVDPISVTKLRQLCSKAIDDNTNTAVARSSRGHVYAARNLIDAAPETFSIFRQGVLRDFLNACLGADAGLVRIPFFDKPPERSWALPWHKDQTIAVADNSMASSVFSRPTTKLGVPHVIASDEILRRMVTLRIHLDDVTDENGPLRVIPGSHLTSQINEEPEMVVETIHAKAGDVLAMRPLITHSSGNSIEGTIRHRRILHLEFSGLRELPDGFRWHRFVAVNPH
jgi:hypothetical protein